MTKMTDIWKINKEIANFPHFFLLLIEILGSLCPASEYTPKVWRYIYYLTWQPLSSENYKSECVYESNWERASYTQPNFQSPQFCLSHERWRKKNVRQLDGRNRGQLFGVIYFRNPPTQIKKMYKKIRTKLFFSLLPSL